MSKLRVGMIGLGDITMMHWPAYRDHPKAEIHAVCDVDEALLARRAREWGVEQCYTDFHELLRDDEIDLVEILTPHHLHEPIVVAAAEAGKHVSVQKPISVSVGEADRMIEATRAAGVKFKVFENFVFYPPYTKAKELIAAGEIGEPLSVRFKLGTGGFGMTRPYPASVELWHLMESEKGMGQAVFDDGYHKWSQAIDLLGEVEVVRGWIDRSFAMADAPAAIMWRYKEGGRLGYFDIAVSLNLHVQSDYFSADERIEVTGTRGVIWITRCTGHLLGTAPLILYRDGKRYLFDDVEADWMASFAASTDHFIDCILDDREPHLTGERAKQVLQLAFAAIRSSGTGEEIRPDEVGD